MFGGEKGRHVCSAGAVCVSLMGRVHACAHNCTCICMCTYAAAPVCISAGMHASISLHISVPAQRTASVTTIADCAAIKHFLSQLQVIWQSPPALSMAHKVVQRQQARPGRVSQGEAAEGSSEEACLPDLKVRCAVCGEAGMASWLACACGARSHTACLARCFLQARPIAPPSSEACACCPCSCLWQFCCMQGWRSECREASTVLTGIYAQDGFRCCFAPHARK